MSFEGGGHFFVGADTVDQETPAIEQELGKSEKVSVMPKEGDDVSVTRIRDAVPGVIDPGTAAVKILSKLTGDLEIGKPIPFGFGQDELATVTSIELEGDHLVTKTSNGDTYHIKKG
jgi:hypothetical protein